MIKQKLLADQLTAMKAKESAKLETLRYILAQIKNVEIEKKQDLAEEEVINIIRRESKKLQDSIASFEAGNRNDLADESKAQLAILAEYLPKEASDDELKQDIQALIDENKDLFEKNPNALIGICVAKLKSKADPSRISQMVRGMQ